MAFPTTGILDTFTGGTEGPITTNWTTPLYSGEGRLERLSNQLTDMGDAPSANAWWDASTFGPDSEAYCTIATKSANANNAVNLLARVQSPGVAGAVDGYEVRFLVQAGTDIVRIRRRDNDASTQLGADILQEFAAGDSVGIECIGSTISAWHKPAAGSWTNLGSRTDSTYTAAGFLAIELDVTAQFDWRIDDFGGGTVVGIPPALPVSSRPLFIYLRKNR